MLKVALVCVMLTELPGRGGRQDGEERSCPYREVWRRIGAGFLEQLCPHLFGRNEPRSEHWRLGGGEPLQ